VTQQPRLERQRRPGFNGADDGIALKGRDITAQAEAPAQAWVYGADDGIALLCLSHQKNNGFLMLSEDG